MVGIKNNPKSHRVKNKLTDYRKSFKNTKLGKWKKITWQKFIIDEVKLKPVMGNDLSFYCTGKLP